MKKSSILVLLVAVFILVSFSFAGDMPKFAAQQQITFDKAMVLANAELVPGTYTITHQMQGDVHYMIFHKDGSKTADIKVKCNLVPLKGKAEHTERHYITNAKNQNVLTELVFKGDEAKLGFETPAL